MSKVRRRDSENGRFRNARLAASDDVEAANLVRAPTFELTYNCNPEDLVGGRNFGHLAFEAPTFTRCAER